jgi:hypothetical protein
MAFQKLLLNFYLNNKFININGLSQIFDNHEINKISFTRFLSLKSCFSSLPKIPFIEIGFTTVLKTNFRINLFPDWKFKSLKCHDGL